jgi:hypothetical protein
MKPTTAIPTPSIKEDDHQIAIATGAPEALGDRAGAYTL